MNFGNIKRGRRIQGIHDYLKTNNKIFEKLIKSKDTIILISGYTELVTEVHNYYKNNNYKDQIQQ